LLKSKKPDFFWFVFSFFRAKLGLLALPPCRGPVWQIASAIRKPVYVQATEVFDKLIIILTNDDGIDAPGLEALEHCARKFGEVVVVAPSQPQSGIAHRVTTRTPIQVKALTNSHFSVEGTPADCTRIALKCLAPDAAWLISGINPGANLGSDVYQSGTVAAAREAAILGCRSIAISQYIARGHQIDWDVSRQVACAVLEMMLQQHLERGRFWNINLPHPLTWNAKPSHRFCALDTSPHQYRYRVEQNAYYYEGVIHERPREPGKDVDECFSGSVSITRIGLDA
jgi:5'/3'-nucleotidase